MAQRSKFIGAPSRNEFWEPQEGNPLSGATKDAKRSVSLLALSSLRYSRIPPPTADLPKRFGLCLLTADINGALHCFYLGFYPPASAVSTAGESFGG